MSGRMVREVLDNAPADLTKQELLVLVSLAESAFDRDRIARENSSADAIADRIRSTPSSVRNTLVALKERGLIVPTIERPSKGHAQQWLVSRLTREHRRALVRDVLPGEGQNRRVASRPGDANGAVSASLAGDANGVIVRHSRMTPSPVDNPDSDESIASPERLAKRHPGVAPPVNPTPVEQQVPATQVPAEVSDDPWAFKGPADIARAALRRGKA